MMLASQSRKSYIKLDHFLLSSVLSPAFLSTFQVINFSLVTWGWLMVTWPIKGPFSKCGFAGQMMWLPSNSSLQCNVDLQTSRSHQGHRGQIYWPLQFVTVAAQGVTPALPAQVSTLSGKHVAYEKLSQHGTDKRKKTKNNKSFSMWLVSTLSLLHSNTCEGLWCDEILMSVSKSTPNNGMTSPCLIVLIVYVNT